MTDLCVTWEAVQEVRVGHLVAEAERVGVWGRMPDRIPSRIGSSHPFFLVSVDAYGNGNYEQARTGITLTVLA